MGRLLRTLQGRIFLCAFAAVLVGVPISAFVIYRYARQTIDRQAREYALMDVSSVAERVEAALDDAYALAVKVAVNPTVLSESSRYHASAGYDEFRQGLAIHDILDNLLANDRLVAEIAFYRPDGSVFHSGSVFRPRNPSWGTGGILEGSREGVFRDGDGDIWYGRKVVSMGEYLGSVYVRIDESTVSGILSASAVPDSILTLFGPDRSVLAGSGDGTYLECPEGKTVAGSEGKRSFVVSRSLPAYGVTVVAATPYASLFTDSLKALRTVLLVTLICIGLCLLVSWFFSLYISRDIRSLRLAMLKVGQGDLTARAPGAKTAEIEDMVEVFNLMLDHLASLSARQARAEEKRKQVEQDYLQLQIQPHFIYNTINSMRYLAHLHGEKEIEDVAVAMGELLRAVLGNSDQFVRLSTEKNFTEQYLVIQRTKYRSDFSVSWDVDPALADTPVPKLILQPVVENALVHGIKDRKGGAITIAAKREGSSLVLTVSDNGGGFDPAGPVVIEKGYRFSSVGLKNVQDRLVMLYGDRSGFRIVSSPGVGTRVRMAIPL